MIILTNAGTDKLQLVTSAAATIDVHASWMDVSGTTVTPGRTNTAITTAATTDIVATPGASTFRNVKTLHVRNKHATLACDVTVIFDQAATDFELHKVALAAGESLEYIEGIGFFTLTNTALLDTTRRLTADSTHATAATFADITGLTVPMLSGRNYNFEACLLHINNATTTGSQFAVNIGAAPTNLIVSTVDTVTASVTASAHSAGTVTARDTAVTAQTTGSTAIVMAYISGWIQPSADGTFAMRATSEVTVASGLIVKAGSWLHVWEPKG